MFGDLKLCFLLPETGRKQSDEKNKAFYFCLCNLSVTLLRGGKVETIFVFLCYLLKIKTIMYEVTFKVISMQHGNDYENNIFRICLKICVSSSVLHLFM